MTAMLSVSPAGLTTDYARMTYDAESLRAYFDNMAAREWDRLEKTLQGRVEHAVHRRLLELALFDKPGRADAGGHLIGVARKPH